MNESTQQIVALSIVAVFVGLELLRRYRKKKAGKAGCDDCDSGTDTKTSAKGEAPIKFYKRGN
jgi:hypothetical protein